MKVSWHTLVRAEASPAEDTVSASGPAVPLPRLHLSLATPGVALARAAQWGMVLLIVGSLGVAFWCWRESRPLDEKAARYELSTARVQELNRQFADQMVRDGLTLTAEQMTTLVREVKFANQLAENRVFSWTRLLSDLEEAVPPRVSISTVTLNFKESTIQLNGAVRALPDLTALVHSLESHAKFRKVVLSQHRVQTPPGGTTGASQPGGTDTTVKTIGKESARQVEFSLTVAYHPEF